MTKESNEVGGGVIESKKNWLAGFFQLNIVEMMERLSYYSVRSVTAIYIAQADNVGGLQLEQHHKGTLYAWWAIIQCFLPIVTGGLADRYGYKKMMVISTMLMSVGYFLMAFMRDLSFISNYTAFFAAIMIFATGSALFKPGIQGALSHILPKDKSSLGWGIFYWIVNIGSLVAHFIPPVLLNNPNFTGLLGESNSVLRWKILFIFAAVMILINLIPLFFFKDVASGVSKEMTPLKLLKQAIKDIFEPRLLTWILIMSGFWLMMFQLWDLQPNFIEDWVSSANVATAIQFLPDSIYHTIVEQAPNGEPRIFQSVLLSFNSIFIILGVVVVSWLTRKMRTLSAMIIGMFMAIIGVLVAGYTQNAWFLILGILFFSLGEMFTGPKKSQYLSEIAPADKKGVYLAYINIPVGVGIFIGSKMAAFIYGAVGEKATLALRYIAEKKGIEWTPFIDKINELEEKTGILRSEAMSELQAITNLDAHAATQLLWDTYSPNVNVWLPFAIIGITSAIALIIFSHCAKKWKDMNA